MALSLGDDDLMAVATAVGVLRDSRPPLQAAFQSSGTLPDHDNIVRLWDRMSARLSSDELFGPFIFDEVDFEEPTDG